MVHRGRDLTLNIAHRLISDYPLIFRVLPTPLCRLERKSYTLVRENGLTTYVSEIVLTTSVHMYIVHTTHT